AAGGRVLEFGVGTGRIALPLAQRSLDVWGVDGSPSMLERLREKPGGEKVTTVCGDFASASADGKFDLVLLLVNTIYAMPTQDDQVTCFANAARQILSPTQIVISETGQTRSFPVVHRYAWPAELDLMARLNGMTLEDRWADWHRRPFGARSTDHISVWRAN